MNISYEVTAGSLQDLSHIEGDLADPGQDFISGTGSVILQDGQTSVAIPVTILEVKTDDHSNHVFLTTLQLMFFNNIRKIIRQYDLLLVFVTHAF